MSDVSPSSPYREARDLSSPDRDLAPTRYDGDRSVDQAGEIIRAEREKRCLSQARLASRAGVSAATVSAVELGYRATNLDLLDRLLDAMDLRLNLEAEPRFADIDTMIATVKGRPLAETMNEWAPDAAAYFTFFLQANVPFMVEGPPAAALQGAPVKVDTLEVVVPDGDEEVLDRLAIMLHGIGARRADYKPADPSVPGVPDYATMHGELRLRLVESFEPVCWIDIDPMPESRRPLLCYLKPCDALSRARVAVTPIAQVEASNARVRRVLDRTRQTTREVPRPAQ